MITKTQRWQRMRWCYNLFMFVLFCLTTSSIALAKSQIFRNQMSKGGGMTYSSSWIWRVLQWRNVWFWTHEMVKLRMMQLVGGMQNAGEEVENILHLPSSSCNNFQLNDISIALLHWISWNQIQLTADRQSCKNLGSIKFSGCVWLHSSCLSL